MDKGLAYEKGRKAVGFLLAIVGLGGVSDDLIQWQDWVSKSGPSPLWWSLLVVGTGLWIGPAAWRWIAGHERENGRGGDTSARPEDLRGSLIANRVVRLIDATTHGVLKGKRFENCEIHGPGLIIPIGSTQMLECGMADPIDALLWEAPQTPRRIVGAICADDVTFFGCTFHGIGFFLSKEQIEHLKSQAERGESAFSSRPGEFGS